ncbi:MAG: GIDE domain-containing protein [Spirulina sp.]
MKRLSRTIAILFLALGLTGCEVNENLTFVIPPDYRGPICFDLGLLKGSLKVRVNNGDLTYRFQTRSREKLTHHALDFRRDRSSHPLNVTIRGELNSGQLNPNLYYSACHHYAGENWQIYPVENFANNRLTWIRIIAAAIGVASFLALGSQIKQLLNLLSAEDYTIEALLQDLQQNRENRYVKISGRVYAENPLESPWKNVSCVYFTKRVTQTYQQSGKKSKTTKTLEYKSRRIPFQLQDDSGSIEVFPNEAIVNAATVYREIQPASPGEIETTESVLPVGNQILVIGMAKYQRDRPVIAQPDFTVKQKTFLIYREDAIAVEKNIRVWIRVSFIFLVLSSTFFLPFLVPEMIDPAMMIYELTKDL